MLFSHAIKLSKLLTSFPLRQAGRNFKIPSRKQINYSKEIEEIDASGIPFLQSTTRYYQKEGNF